MKKKRKFHQGGFSQLESDLIQSEAFAALSTANAVRTLVRFWQKRRFKRKGKKGKGKCTDELANNGKIVFTYTEAAELGMSESTFLRVLKELIALGFIDIDEENQDGFIPGKGRRPTKYTISKRWRFYGNDGPGAFDAREKPRINPKGIGFKRGNKQGKKLNKAAVGDR